MKFKNLIDNNEFKLNDKERECILYSRNLKSYEWITENQVAKLDPIIFPAYAIEPKEKSFVKIFNNYILCQKIS